MITAAEFFGSATTISTGSMTIDQRYRLWVITATTTGRTITLPNVLTPDLPLGSPAFVIVNGGVNNFTLAGTGFTSFTLNGSTSPPRKAAIILGTKLSDGSFRWAYDLRNAVI